MKNTRYLKSYLYCFFALTVIFFSTAALGATIHVPGDYPTIQEAINATSYSGDTVLVADGTYTGTGNRDLDFYGKAITVQSENGPENCIIDCEGSGRGFYFHSNEGEDSVVSGFTITHGKDYYGDGGGIYCYQSDATITNCTITENSAGPYGGDGGGIYCDDSSPTITNCTISGNSAPSGGGGIYCDDSSPTITNCTISGNSASGGGGGIYCCYSSDATITNCTISGNSAGGYSGDGGGIYCSSSMTITNCTISGNSAGDGGGDGGGIYCYGSDATITNCTITGNTASGGGGIYGSATITNCIFWNDTPVEIQASGGDVPVVTYSDIQGGYSGEGNINADPLFVSDSDYHLTESSPCINAGYNEAPSLPETDMDGEQRIMNGIVDIGADEYTSAIGGDITHTLTPPSNTTVSQGSLLGPFYASATNNSSSSYSFYICPYIGTPDGNWILKFTNFVTLAAGETRWARNGNALYIWVPYFAQTGTTYHCVNIYDTSYNLIDQDCFSFEVTAGSSSVQSLENDQRLKTLLNSPDAKVHEKDGWKMIIVPEKRANK